MGTCANKEGGLIRTRGHILPTCADKVNCAPTEVGRIGSPERLYLGCWMHPCRYRHGRTRKAK
eukprot:6994625-Pyramimonas_sp.AAC.1